MDSALNILKETILKKPCYIIFVFIITIIIRLLLCFFKTLAIKNKEIDDEQGRQNNKKWSDSSKIAIFKHSFISNGDDYKINDHWLPALIGGFELIVFPVLMASSLWKFIGAWIAIKTASSWGGWQKTRTAYNRFLLGNILSLSFSYLLRCIFIK
jgi:hypothetical protein